MHTTRRAFAALAVPLVTATALAACGSGDGDTTSSSSSSSSSTSTAAKPPTAAELFDQARTTALAAKSTHITGSITDDGKPITVDLAGTTDGSNQSLELGIGSGAKVTILTVAGKYYLLGNAKFWSRELGGDAAKLLDGKYVKIPPTEVKEFGDLTIKSLLTDMFEDKDMQAAVKAADAKVTKTTVDGAAAYSIGDSTGGELVVSADGKATIFKVVGPSDDEGELEFSEWDKVAKVAAPNPSTVIDPPK